jgi:hypothetical protein
MTTFPRRFLQKAFQAHSHAIGIQEEITVCYLFRSCFEYLRAGIDSSRFSKIVLFESIQFFSQVWGLRRINCQYNIDHVDRSSEAAALDEGKRPLGPGSV